MRYRHWQILVNGLFIIVIFFTTFRNIHLDQFLYLQDEYLPVSKAEIVRSFLTIDPVDFGSRNSTIMLVTFWDRIIYSAISEFSLPLIQIQYIIYLLKLIILFFVPLAGFRKIKGLYKLNIDSWMVWVVSFWYSLNTYTVVYWHGNAFGLTLILCYSFAPVGFLFFNKAILANTSRLKDKIVYALLMFLMSFGLYLFMVFVIIQMVYLLIYLIKKPESLKICFINCLHTGLVMFPLFSMHYLVFREMLTNVGNSVNSSGGETYGNLQGGVLYQILMWNSWAIYVDWFPRNIYTFSRYFRLPASIIAPFVLYTIMIWKLVKNKLSLNLLILLLVLLAMLFMAKGSQEPLGGIYTVLINKFQLFRVFRSPDNKFGFGIVFILALILINIFHGINKKLFAAIFLVSLIQSYPLLIGIAIRGENTRTSSDRIIEIPEQQRQVIEFLNKNTHPWGYVLAFPPESFNHYTFSNKKYYIGQDLIAKSVYLPIVGYSEFTGMSKANYQRMKTLISNNDFSVLKDLPIKYFLVRYDVSTDAPNPNVVKQLSSMGKPVFYNTDYTVYENIHFAPIIEGINITFNLINPSEYKITTQNSSAIRQITLKQNLDNEWKLYRDMNPLNHNKDNLGIVKYLFAEPIPIIPSNYNTWEINAQSRYYRIIYWPQMYFYASSMITFIYAGILITSLGKLK